jgi:hypothetical protein
MSITSGQWWRRMLGRSAAVVECYPARPGEWERLSATANSFAVVQAGRGENGKSFLFEP